MKKETLQYAKITISEYWQPSVKLRFVKNFNGKKVLQQLYTSDLGSMEWRDVPTEI